MILNIRKCRYYLAVHQQQKGLPGLLLLHGFMGSGRVFEHLIDSLTEFCNPVTVDLIGHGKTGKPDESARFTVEEQVKDLHKIIQEMEFEDIYLHGYSMGGRLALRYAIDHQGLKGLILESTNYGIENAEEKADRKILDEERAREIEKDFEYFLNDWANLPLFNTGLTTHDDIRNTYINIQQDQEAYAMANSLRGFGTANMAPIKNELPELNLPVLLLAGEADEKYLGIMQEMHEIMPHSRFEVIKKAGHRIHLENPNAFIERVRGFIRE